MSETVSISDKVVVTKKKTSKPINQKKIAERSTVAKNISTPIEEQKRNKKAIIPKTVKVPLKNPANNKTDIKKTHDLKTVKQINIVGRKKRKSAGASDFLMESEGVIARYLKEIDKIKLLTREEEIELARRIAEGDEISKEKLIQANLRFVVNIAKKYQKRGLPLIDLISEGNLGLITAAQKFDGTRGFHFISYAVWWIKQSILKALSEKTRIIRLPLNRANQNIMMDRLKRENENISEEEICSQLGMSQDTKRDIENANQDPVSLEMPIIRNKRERTLSDLIEDSSIDKPEKTVVHASLKETLESVLNQLSEKEQKVIKHRYGLGGHKTLSLKQIGELEKLTKERIRQIEKKTLKKLQSVSRQEILRPFLQTSD